MNRFEEPRPAREYGRVRKTFQIDQFDIEHDGKYVCTILGDWEVEAEWDDTTGKFYVERIYALKHELAETPLHQYPVHSSVRIDDVPAFKVFVEAAQRWLDRLDVDESELMELAE